MAILSHRRDWTFALEDRALKGSDHRIEALIENRGLAFSLTIWLDGDVQVQEKGSDLEELWGDYPLRVDQCSCTVRAFRKGLLGLATDFELRVEEQVIAEGKHVTITACEPESQQPESPVLGPHPESALASGGVEPIIPSLPPTCSTCGASLSMDEVRWVGPLTAQCPYCGTNVSVEWRKIG